MKKLFALLAVVLAVVSCQKDADLVVNVGGEQLVNITVGLPEATRAASDTGFDLTTLEANGLELRYILEIYVEDDNSGNDENRIRKELFTTDTDNVVFPVRLVPKRNYRVVAWADIVPAVANRDVEGDFDYDYYYDTSDGLDAVTIIENKWNAMDEKRDAYTAYQVVNNFTANTAINLTLKRPFAKLRVVSTDIKDIEDLGYTLEDGVVEYSVDLNRQLNRQFNALYGTANAASSKRHTLDYPTPYDDKDNKNSRTLFADYIFVDDIEQQDAVQFTLSVNSQYGHLKTTTFNTDIALRANTLTTIIGEVLTEGGNVQIKIDGELNDDQAKDYTVVSSASHLLKAINIGGEYMLGNDIIVTADDVNEAQGIITRGDGVPTTTTINLNGKTITVNNQGNNAFVNLDNNDALVLAGEGTIKGGKLVDGGTVVVTGSAQVTGGVSNVKTGIDALKYILANGGEFTFTDNLASEDNLLVTTTNPVVIDGNGNTITFTSNANRGFRITASNTVTFENVTIVNEVNGGRCVDTRTGDINLTFNNVNLIAKGTYSQPLTIGGSDNDNLVVNLNNSTIEACHYGIITFNPVALNINNSEISGYAALYIKPGSAGSEINVVNSILTGPNKWAQHASNSFATVAIEDNNININIDGNSTLVADSTYNEQVLFAIGAGGATEALRGCNIVVAVGAEIEIKGTESGYVGLGEIQKYLYDNVIKFPAKYAANLEAEGWIVSEPVNGLVTLDNTAVVSTADELVEALENKASVKFANDILIDPANMSNAYGKTGINVHYGQTIDGAGHTLNINGAGGTWDSGINTTGGLIKNLTVTGSYRGIFINHTGTYSEKVVLENVTLGGNRMVYTISCDQGKYQTIEATNCTFNGWTSFAKTAGEAKFVNCSFGEGSGYKYCRPYSNTEFVNCTFCPGYSVDTTRATVTFTDCTFEE